MRIFVYEFITGGGLLPAAESPAKSLLREGSAMVAALATDFAAIDGVHVTVLQDRRLRPIAAAGIRVVEVANATEGDEAFAALARTSDWTVVIAPESDGTLLQRCQRVEAVGGRLFGPPCELVRLAADKQAAAEHLHGHGIPVPHGRSLESGEPISTAGFPYPAVLKPRDGAGSVGVRLVETPADAPEFAPWPARLEAYCPGTPASISVLGGTAGPVVLPPSGQRLSDDGRFTFLGGMLPLSPNLAQRARRLAGRVTDSLPSFVGYLGIDLILGPDASGHQDYVIEVNPRLTTSYVGLRAATENNLATAIRQLAEGETPALSFGTDAIEFDTSGEVRIEAAPMLTNQTANQR